jgi:hypothetical protein
LDSRPSCCPTGLDSATARLVADNVLMEEGDGYLEVWERIGSASAITTVSLEAKNGTEKATTTTTTGLLASEFFASGGESSSAWILRMELDAAVTANVMAKSKNLRAEEWAGATLRAERRFIPGDGDALQLTFEAHRLARDTSSCRDAFAVIDVASVSSRDTK